MPIIIRNSLKTSLIAPKTRLRPWLRIRAKRNRNSLSSSSNSSTLTITTVMAILRMDRLITSLRIAITTIIGMSRVSTQITSFREREATKSIKEMELGNISFQM